MQAGAAATDGGKINHVVVEFSEAKGNNPQPVLSKLQVPIAAHLKRMTQLHNDLLLSRHGGNDFIRTLADYYQTSIHCLPFDRRPGRKVLDWLWPGDLSLAGERNPLRYFASSARRFCKTGR